MSEAANDGCLPRFLRIFGGETSKPTPESLRQTKMEVISNPAHRLSVPPAPPTNPTVVPVTPAKNPPLKLSADDKLPYRLTRNFLSRTELEFYEALKQCVQHHALIMVKVRLADLFDVNDRNNNHLFFNKVALRHVDFLLCHPQTLKPLIGIELDDSSHRREERMRRDDEVNIIFAAVALPLLRFQARRAYKVAEIGSRIERFLFAALKEAEQPVNEVIPDTTPFCRVCGSTMVLRIARQGKNAGNQFWACSRFPACRGTRNLDDLD